MVVSFSVTKHDTDSVRRVERLKKVCLSEGLSFSHIVLEGLKMYEHKARVQDDK